MIIDRQNFGLQLFKFFLILVSVGAVQNNVGVNLLRLGLLGGCLYEFVHEIQLVYNILLVVHVLVAQNHNRLKSGGGLSVVSKE